MLNLGLSFPIIAFRLFVLSNKYHDKIIVTNMVVAVVIQSRRNDGLSMSNITVIPATIAVIETNNNGAKIPLAHEIILICKIFRPNSNLAIEQATIQPKIVQLTDNGPPPIFNTNHDIGALEIHSNPVVI